MTVTTVVDGDTVQLTVRNSGPPVPPYEVPALFEPFRRLPSTDRIADDGNPSISRGAGRGLSIVRSVARARGGEVHASSRQGGGLSVGVRIPIAALAAVGLPLGSSRGSVGQHHLDQLAEPAEILPRIGRS